MNDAAAPVRDEWPYVGNGAVMVRDVKPGYYVPAFGIVETVDAATRRVYFRDRGGIPIHLDTRQWAVVHWEGVRIEPSILIEEEPV